MSPTPLETKSCISLALAHLILTLLQLSIMSTPTETEPDLLLLLLLPSPFTQDDLLSALHLSLLIRIHVPQIHALLPFPPAPSQLSHGWPSLLTWLLAVSQPQPIFQGGMQDAQQSGQHHT